jgi:hypothetical protein
VQIQNLNGFSELVIAAVSEGEVFGQDALRTSVDGCDVSCWNDIGQGAEAHRQSCLVHLCRSEGVPSVHSL